MRVLRVPLCVVACMFFASAQGASITLIPKLPSQPYPLTQAYDVADDGGAVVGDAAGAYRWTPAGGTASLTSLQFPQISEARAVSADGSVVAGSGYRSQFGTYQAQRWTAATGAVSLGSLSGSFGESGALGMTGDGSMIVGYSNSSSGTEAFRWSAGGMVGLGDLPGGDFFSVATAVSANGTVVVGHGNSPNFYGNPGLEAFRWTAVDGMTGLGRFALGGASIARGVSPDGSVIVGEATNDSGVWQSFRWTQDGGLQSIGSLPSGNGGGVARAASNLGEVIVGEASESGTYGAAFIWTEEGGMQYLRDVLIGRGVDVPFQLIDATAISPDGRFVVGSAYIGGGFQGFIADLAVVPVPAAAWLFASGLAVLAPIARRGSRIGRSSS